MGLIINMKVPYPTHLIDFMWSQNLNYLLTNELALMLPIFTKQDRQKRGILPSIITGFIGLAPEGISTFLHYKR